MKHFAIGNRFVSRIRKEVQSSEKDGTWRKREQGIVRRESGALFFPR